MDHTSENKRIIEECHELVLQLREKADDDEKQLLKNASLDYQLVYFAKKNTDSRNEQKSRDAEKAIQALFALNMGLRIKQKNYLLNMLKKSNFPLREIDFTERDQEVLIDALEKIDLSKICNQKPVRKRYEYEQKLFWNETKKQLTEDEIKNLSDADKAKKTYLKKIRTGKYKIMPKQNLITPSTFSFSYRYRAYLIASNKKYITQKNADKKSITQEIDDIDSTKISSIVPTDLIDLRLDIERLFNKKKITLLQYLLFFLAKDPDNFPEHYSNKLTSVEKYKAQLNTKHIHRKRTNAEIAILLGCSESTISRNMKVLEKVLDQINGTAKTELSEESILNIDKEKVRTLNNEIAVLEKELEYGRVNPNLQEKYQKTLKHMKRKRDCAARHIEIIELHRSGMKNKDIAKKLNVSKYVVSKNLSRK